MPELDSISGLLADLDTLTDIARAGVLSRAEMRLEEGETRPAAVLFVDVVGFSQLSRQLTTEQLATLVDRTFRIFELTVKGFGGYCDKVIGDAGLYVFCGHPNYPPVCEAALQAGLGILDRAGQISASLSSSGLGLEVRAGVAFGDVTRRKAGGEEQRESVFGTTVNLAQRMQSAALPGSLRTTEAVLDRAGDLFEAEDCGLEEMKGIGEVRNFRVSGLRPRQTRLRGAFSQLSPLVGRRRLVERCLATLQEWEAAGRLPGLLILSGPAAVGKSRLALELSQQLTAHEVKGIATSTAHCVQQASFTAFCSEILAFAGLAPLGLRDRWEELCSAAQELHGPEYAQRGRAHLPVLAFILGSDEADSSGVRQADINTFRLAAKLALRACLEMTDLEGRRIVLVIEDLQWMEELGELLAGLMQGLELSKAPWIIATARPEYKHEPGALGEGRAQTLVVEPLGREAGGELLEALLPGLELPAQVEAELHEKAAGLPYYYEEFARMLLRRGIAVPAESADGGLSYSLAGEITELALPENVQALILGRLDQLPPELKELAMRASVLGRSFSAGLLDRLEQRLGLQEARTLDARLLALTGEHILVREESAAGEV